MAFSIKKLLHWKVISSLLMIGLVGLLGKNMYDDYKHRQWVAGLESTASDNVHILPDTILVDYLGEKRTLAIYLPEEYDNDTTRYPVIYFMDGDSQFDQKIQEGVEWQVDEVIDSVAAAGGPASIVVAVYNHATDRSTEYKPVPSKEIRGETVVTGPQHAEWIATDVKDWVDNRYRTLSDADHTTIGGCSLSGLMSWYMISHFPDVYGNAIIFSPSLWVGDEVYTWQDNYDDWSDKRIYLNAGSIEWPVVEWVQKLHGLLEGKGMTEDNLRIDIIPDEGHWHMTWRKGFRQCYPWIVG